jgi:DNA-binding transcriptional MerR regulator
VYERSTRSIGEVLALLKQEFDDITISKIRFLEGQGLIEPDRTPSGYRKFSDSDIEKLRFILRAQKDHFLPLKVIKARLKEREAQVQAAAQATSRGEGPQVMVSTEVTPVSLDSMVMSGGAMLSRSDLLTASGLTESQLREVEGFSLIVGQKTANGIWYAEESAIIAKLAARFLHFGVEPRHLRIFKTAAQREADLYRQLAGPVLGSRNTQARMEAVARLEELHGLGEQLRGELLRQAINTL